jgi:4-amino-4-deoxy-L-arabinose transferase-like glycosyltransferase
MLISSRTNILSLRLASCVRLDFFSVMAARSAASPARWRRPFLAWLDGIEHGWAIPLLIIAFAAAWTLFFFIAYLSGDLHQDALETWSLGRSFSWGGDKHPPLMGWVAHLWTQFFPLTGWSFQLLAMTNAALALWSVDLIARRFVRGDKRAVVLLLLMLLPAYQFHAQRFNANTVLLAVWPLATLCFLRSFETRRIGWAVAAGAVAALAMLGKYYSVFLLGGFLFAALCDPRRKVYFASLAPWISLLAGAIVLAPHIHWLMTSGASSFAYAIEVHGGLGLWPSLYQALFFVLGILATLALPALCWVLMDESRLKNSAADFRALDPGLWLLFLVCIGTLVLPLMTTVAVGTDMPSLWALQGLFLIVILVVCGARFRIPRFYTVNLTVLVLGIATVAVTLAAPAHAVYRNAYGPNERSYYSLAAAELTRRWHQFTSASLLGITGNDGLAFATAFYAADHPLYQHSPPLATGLDASGDSTAERGWAAVCFANDRSCLNWMESVAKTVPDAIRTEFVVTPRLWGQPGIPARIAAMLAPPHGDSTQLSEGVNEFSASRRQR